MHSNAVKDPRPVGSCNNVSNVVRPSGNVVIWNSEKKVLVFPDTKQFARGLTKSLAAEFMPHYSFSVAIKSLPTRKAKKRGQYLGSLADRQLTTWATTGKIPKGRKCARFKIIQQALVDHQLIPIFAQLPVGFQDIRLATMIDLVCRDLKGRIILVELKCGFDDYFHVTNQGNMLKPLQSVPASFQNKAWLQLWLSTHMYHETQHRFHQYPYHASYLLHVFENSQSKLKYCFKPLPEWVCSLDLDEVKNTLKRSSTQNKRQRDRAVSNGCRRTNRKFKKLNS